MAERDESLLVTASDDGTARMWEVQTGKEIGRLSHKGFVGLVAFSADGHYVVTGSADNTARIWRTDSGAQVAEFLHVDSVSEVTFSPDGGSVATSSEDQTARVWDVATGKEVFRIRFEGPVRTVAFSPDGNHGGAALSSFSMVYGILLGLIAVASYQNFTAVQRDGLTYRYLMLRLRAAYMWRDFAQNSSVD